MNNTYKDQLNILRDQDLNIAEESKYEQLEETYENYQDEDLSETSSSFGLLDMSSEQIKHLTHE